MVRRTLQVCGHGAFWVVLLSGVAVFGQGRPSMEKKESRPEPRKESRPEPRKESRPEPRNESRPEPRKESRPEPRREVSRPEPSRNMPRNDGGGRGSSGQSGNREAPAVDRPAFGGGKADGGGPIGNLQSREQMKEQAELNRLEALRLRKERDEQDRIEREREEREEAEFKKKQQLEEQRLAELRREIQRLEAIDLVLAAERRQELRRLEKQWRDQEDARERDREVDRLRRGKQNWGVVPAPPIAPIARVKPARGAAAKPVKPVEPGPAPLTAEQLAVAFKNLESGDLKQELAALDLLAKAAADENRVNVAKAIEPHLNKADPVKFKAAAKALAVWASVEQVPQLLELLPDLDKAARRDAIVTLGTLKDVRAIVPLVELLTVPVDRHAAVEALTAIGPKAAPLVTKQLVHDEFWVRAAAVDVLAEVGGAESRDALKQLAEDDPEAFVRTKASNAVRQLGG